MNSVSAPSRALTSRRNLAASRVTSVKPVPGVSTASEAETIELALTVEGAESEDAVDRLMRGSSNLAPDVLLHAVGHLDQPPPRFFQKRHHAVHVAVARQRDFDLPLALGNSGLRLLQRIRLRQLLVRLARDSTALPGELRFQFFIVGLQPSDLGVECSALVRRGIAGPASACIAA